MVPEIVCSGERYSNELYAEIRRPCILKGRLTAINLGCIDSRLTFACGFRATRGDDILSVMGGVMYWSGVEGNTVK